MLGVITGSGFYQLDAIQPASKIVVDTPYGDAAITRGQFDGKHELVFLARHGTDHSVPPHVINYRANIWALREVGVTEVLATAVSGGIRDDLVPGAFVVIDDFIDFTSGRKHTFFDEPGNLAHADMARPYDPGLRDRLVTAASRSALPLLTGATYCATNGPRFESRSEIQMMRRLGGDLVGMTGCPEVTLAKELGLPYASIGVISNRAVGLADHEFTLDEIMGVLSDAIEPLQQLIRSFLEVSKP